MAKLISWLKPARKRKEAPDAPVEPEFISVPDAPAPGSFLAELEREAAEEASLGAVGSEEGRVQVAQGMERFKAAEAASADDISDAHVLDETIDSAELRTAGTLATDESATPTKESFLQRFKQGRGKATATAGVERPKFQKLPVRVIIGFLPEVTENDALEFALGIAQKHFDQIGLAYYEAFEYDNGFIYEIHEGGEGKAYAPEIIKYFESQGPFKTGEKYTVVIRTSTRKIEVQRSRSGLTSVMLPESSDTEPTPWLQGTTLLTPALNQRKGLIVVGGALFATGFLAIVIASFMRYQPYLDTQPSKPEILSLTNLPIGQLAAIQAVPEGSYVKALRYRRGKWEPLEVSTPSTAEAASAASAP